jgi:hypothetical protein
MQALGCEGRSNFDWVLAELRNRGRDQISVIAEHRPSFESVIEATVRAEEEWLANSVRFLRSKLSHSAEKAVN